MASCSVYPETRIIKSILQTLLIILFLIILYVDDPISKNLHAAQFGHIFKTNEEEVV